MILLPLLRLCWVILHEIADNLTKIKDLHQFYGLATAHFNTSTDRKRLSLQKFYYWVSLGQALGSKSTRFKIFVCSNSVNSFMTYTLSYWNQCIDLLCKSVDWFLYDRYFRHERVNGINADICLELHSHA